MNGKQKQIPISKFNELLGSLRTEEGRQTAVRAALDKGLIRDDNEKNRDTSVRVQWQEPKPSDTIHGLKTKIYLSGSTFKELARIMKKAGFESHEELLIQALKLFQITFSLVDETNADIVLRAGNTEFHIPRGVLFAGHRNEMFAVIDSYEKNGLYSKVAEAYELIGDADKSKEVSRLAAFLSE